MMCARRRRRPSADWRIAWAWNRRRCRCTGSARRLARITTLINFALFDLVGKALTPRMRDLTRVTLVRDGTPTEIGRA